MRNQQYLNTALAEMLDKEHAHAGIEKALNDLTVDIAGKQHEQLPYSIWQLMSHIDATIWDIINFIEDPTYKSPDWPDGYWPEENSPTDEKELQSCKNSIIEGKRKMAELINNPKADLLRPLAHGQGQTLFREAILVIDHTAYHLGEIIVLRRLFNDWK